MSISISMAMSIIVIFTVIVTFADIDTLSIWVQTMTLSLIYHFMSIVTKVIINKYNIMIIVINNI